MLPTVSGVGRLTADPDLSFSQNGKAYTRVSIAFNSRRFNKQTDEWEDGDVCFLRGTAFDRLAEQVGEQLSKGVEVYVSARVRTERWQDKNSGENRQDTKLLIDVLRPVQPWAKDGQQSGRSSGSGFGGGSGGREQERYDDPWGSAPPAGSGPAQDEEPPF